MRKLIRNIIRENAKKKHYTPSAAVKAFWNDYQIKKSGAKARKINQATSTHKWKVWEYRKNLFVKN